MNVDLRHPLEGVPLLAPHLIDVLPFNVVFQCNSDRLGTGPVISIAHFVGGDITDGMVTGFVISEIIAALSEQLHPDHEYLTFDTQIMNTLPLSFGVHEVVGTSKYANSQDY
jgi:hypothetical protein